MKERIIGAAVLVLFVVLVVPVFLDGPPSEDEIISESVSLPGQSEQKSQTVVLDRDREEPVPSNGGARSAEEKPEPKQVAAQQQQQPEPRPVIKQPAPAPKEAPPPQAAADDRTPTTSATGMWAVQLGSFSSQENAERLASDLRRQGFAAFLSELSTGTGELHRVRIGPQKDRESAERMAERLAKAGHKGQVVPHP